MFEESTEIVCSLQSVSEVQLVHAVILYKFRHLVCDHPETQLTTKTNKQTNDNKKIHTGVILKNSFPAS